MTTLALPDLIDWVATQFIDAGCSAGNAPVSAPFGEPAVFFRVGSQHVALFEGMRTV